MLRKFIIKSTNYLSLKKQYRFIQQKDLKLLSIKEVNDIQTMHSTYIQTSSNEIFTISLDAAFCIAVLIKKLQPKIIWDLGSGFTSWLCHYISNSDKLNSNILSFDTSIHWMNVVNTFLKTSNYTFNGYLCTRQNIESFISELETPNLIIHDLGDEMDFSIRQLILPQLGQQCLKGAYLFVDDLHKPEIHSAAKNTIALYNLQVQDLSQLTFDKFGRYAWLLIPPNYAC